MCHVPLRGSGAVVDQWRWLSEETGLELGVAAIRMVGSDRKPATVEPK